MFPAAAPEGCSLPDLSPFMCLGHSRVSHIVLGTCKKAAESCLDSFTLFYMLHSV